MKRIAALSLGGAAALLGCETFIALGDDYTEQCDALATVYRDADQDGEGNLYEPLVWCGDPPPEYVTNTLDCNDESPDVNTRAPDDQCDGIDQDCDEKTDEDYLVFDCQIKKNEAESCQGRPKCEGGLARCFALFFLDRDGDGMGREEHLAETPESCATPSPPPGGGVYVTEGSDCDDTNDAIHPGADELCDDDVDQNCNGTVGRVYLRQTFSGDVLNAGAPGQRWSSGTNSGFLQTTPSGGACNRPDDDVTPTDDGILVGVGLGACVPPGASGELESPIVDTAGALNLQVVFHEWIDVAPGGAPLVPPTVTLAVQQGSQRTTLPRITDGEPMPGWNKVVTPLGAFAGPNTSIVWSYESGDAVGWGGYAIDDVELVDEMCAFSP